MIKLISNLVNLLTFSSSKKVSDREKAIQELNSYTDRELADLGISRFGIQAAVDYGRA
ncbi:hypothetical protein ACFQ45_03590 [Rhodanobacter aciditrophus]|uniref:DUF1127 domain-containing protein n=1 Tax=Rhodanobacter aciditrophus TaxID=1623218 RepID=A0ABW4AWW8_9GAMM